jgi:hypothetical protein
MNFHILYRNLPMTYLLGAAHLRKLIPRTSHTCCEWSLCKELTGTSHARLESLSVHSSGWTLPRNRQDIQSKRCSRDERTAWNFNENPHSEFKVSFFVIMQEQAIFLRGAGSIKQRRPKTTKELLPSLPSPRKEQFGKRRRYRGFEVKDSVVSGEVEEEAQRYKQGMLHPQQSCTSTRMVSIGRSRPSQMQGLLQAGSTGAMCRRSCLCSGKTTRPGWG